MLSAHSNANRDAVAAWVAALRSGRYRQGTCALRKWTYGRGGFAFCPLGVACDVMGGVWSLVMTDAATAAGFYSFQGATGYLPEAVIAWLGLQERPIVVIEGAAYDVAELNDLYDYTFEQIADALGQTYLGEVREVIGADAA